MVEDEGDAVRLGGRVLAGFGARDGEAKYSYMFISDVREEDEVQIRGDAVQTRSGVTGFRPRL